MLTTENVRISFIHIGDQAVIEAGFASCFGIKSTVSIEKCPREWNAQAFDRLETALQIGLQIKSVMSIACDNASTGKDETIGIGNRQNIAGLGTFARFYPSICRPFGVSVNLAPAYLYAAQVPIAM